MHGSMGAGRNRQQSATPCGARRLSLTRPRSPDRGVVRAIAPNAPANPLGLTIATPKRNRHERNATVAMAASSTWP